MDTDSILLVSCAERHGWDDGSRGLIRIRPDMNSSSAEAIYFVFHIMGMRGMGVGISIGQRLKSIRDCLRHS